MTESYHQRTIQLKPPQQYFHKDQHSFIVTVLPLWVYERNLMVWSFQWNLDLRSAVFWICGEILWCDHFNEGILSCGTVFFFAIWEFHGMKFGIFLEYLFLVPLHAINTGAIYLKILEILGVVATMYYHVPNLTDTFQTFNVTWHWVCWPNTYDVEVPDHSKETSKRFNVSESVDEILCCDH